MLIFGYSKPERGGQNLGRAPKNKCDLPEHFLRKDPTVLPEISELQVVRHYTNLSRKNFSIDTHFYPLGSCTMKYNPKAAHHLAALPEFLMKHPYLPETKNQGFLACLYELQEILQEVTGMSAVSLTPMAGAQGEFAGVAIIRAYHAKHADFERTEMLVPDAAHGTNPASAAMCGYTVREVPTTMEGDLDVEKLKLLVGPKTAGIMLTNPSTFGTFERNITEVADIIHRAGGLLYYDGANLNAILGIVKPADMGFDVMHLNLHKTFATPHGGGGPGSGPVAVRERLKPFIPIPIVGKKNGEYVWFTEKEFPDTIGCLSAFMGNAGILLRAYVYVRMLGKEGFKRVGQFATLNANYLLALLQQKGFKAAFPGRRASHEFIISLKSEAKTLGLTAMDMAKRLLDYGYHAPTTYFPLLVPECLLIEPTETESKEELDGFANAMEQILKEAENDIDFVKAAPHSLPIKRVDEVKAARELDLTYRG